MDEREKIKFRIGLGIQDHGEIFHRELIKALNHEKNRFSTKEMDKTLVDCIADALIAANIGDVTEWKERAEKEKTEKNKWKCTANDWKQRFESREKQLAELRTTSYEAVIRKDRVISEQKSEIDRLSTERDEYKHRAEVAEERLEKLKKTDGDLTIEDEINMLENTVEEARHRSFVFERELVKYKIAFDKAIKLAYKLRTDLDVLSCSSCEFGYAIDTCKKIGLYDDCENRWKEELLQQAEREIEREA